MTAGGSGDTFGALKGTNHLGVHGVVGGPRADARRTHERPAGAVRRRRVRRLRLLRSEIDTPTIDRLAAEAAVHRLPHHGDVLDHPRRAPHRTQPPLGGHGLPARLRQRVPRHRGKIAGGRATMAEICGRTATATTRRQVARHPADRDRAAGPFDGGRSAAASTASTGSSTPRPTSTPRAGARQHARHRRRRPPPRLPPHRRPGRRSDRIPRRPRGATPDTPWFLMLAPGACHAPHRRRGDLIDKYTRAVREGLGPDPRRSPRPADRTRYRPRRHGCPQRNPVSGRGTSHSDDERRLFARLAGRVRAMLEHFDQQLGRLVDSSSGRQLDDTIVLVVGQRRQPGGRTARLRRPMGPFNMIARADGPRSSPASTTSAGRTRHSNFPRAGRWPPTRRCKRYKQNTHGGGIRDPLVVSRTGRWISSEHAAACATSSATPPTSRRPCSTCSGSSAAPEMKGVSFASTLADPPDEHRQDHAVLRDVRPSWDLARRLQSRGLPLARPHRSTNDVWELYDLANDFNETTTSRASSPNGSPNSSGCGGSRPKRIRCCRSTTGSAKRSPSGRRAAAPVAPASAHQSRSSSLQLLGLLVREVVALGEVAVEVVELPLVVVERRVGA